MNIQVLVEASVPLWHNRTTPVLLTAVLLPFWVSVRHKKSRWNSKWWSISVIIFTWNHGQHQWCIRKQSEHIVFLDWQNSIYLVPRKGFLHLLSLPQKYWKPTSWPPSWVSLSGGKKRKYVNCNKETCRCHYLELGTDLDIHNPFSFLSVSWFCFSQKSNNLSWFCFPQNSSNSNPKPADNKGKDSHRC